jgi:mannose-6-phosphate isomerase-like protein (cupin superfamily)
MNFFLLNKPFIVPTTDGKLIEEHFGRVSTSNENISIAHMVAPAGWSEPSQSPEFDEWTLVSKGRKSIEVDGTAMVLQAGQSILVKKRCIGRVQQSLQTHLVNIGVYACRFFN